MSDGSVPEGSIRAFDAARVLAAVAASLNRNARALGASSTTEDELRRFLSPTRRDLADDRWIALAAGCTCRGFAAVSRPTETPCVELTLTEATDDRGTSMLGPRLDFAMHRSRELGVDSALTYIPLSYACTAGFLRGHGFQAVNGYCSFAWEASVRADSPTWPTGFRLRAFSQAQGSTDPIEADNRCYHEQWGHRAATEASVRQVLEALPPGGILLLYVDDNAIVGCTKVTELQHPHAGSGDPTGYLDGSGLVPRLRGRRLHAQLARAGLNSPSERGHHHGLMDTWGDHPQAIRHYEAVGFIRTTEELAVAFRWTDTDTPRAPDFDANVIAEGRASWW